MRIVPALMTAALIGAIPAGPALAKPRYTYNGKNYYETREACLAAKDRSKKRGTIVGAAAAGVGAALLGGNLGETALVAGGGAVVGHELGKNAKKC